MVPSQLASTDRLHQQILTLNSLLMLVVDNDLPVMFFVLHSLMCIDERLRFIFAPIHRRNGVNLQLQTSAVEMRQHLLAEALDQLCFVVV